MLRELSVQNLALLEDAHVELQHGYCAWTGETGAGKSLLLTALGLVLGGKTSADLVRAGKPEARAAAVFELAGLDLRSDIETILGGAVDDDQIILTRRISATTGRGSAQVNGMPVTVATLQALGALLVDIHGQTEGRALADPDRQRALIDTHGRLTTLRNAYAGRREAFSTLRRRRIDLIQKSQDRRRERALLTFERDELAAAEPKLGETEELNREAHRLANAGQLRNAASVGYSLLYEADCSAQGLLDKVARAIGPLALSVPELAEPAETLARLAAETREVAYSLRDLGQTWDDDPERLECVESRLALYRRLANRFHCAPDELVSRLDESETRLAALDQDDADLASLDVPLAQAWSCLRETAQALSSARGRTAKAFAKAIQARLRPLGLEGARLDVAITTSPMGDDPTMAAPPESGIDRVDIMFSANPGEPVRPLRKVASGGELSRVTLALKAVLAGADQIPTLIFDEIDNGVGGRLGGVLGRTLAELAEHHQVICVTHLPQMASYASAQWVIRKHVDRGKTRTTITHLNEADRVTELAAMLRGDSAAEGTRKEAKAMLIEARARRC